MRSCRYRGGRGCDETMPFHAIRMSNMGLASSIKARRNPYSGRGMVEAGPGDVITVNPGEVHDGMPIGDAGRSWRMLYFDPAIISQAIDDMNEGAARPASLSGL